MSNYEDGLKDLIKSCKEYNILIEAKLKNIERS